MMNTKRILSTLVAALLLALPQQAAAAIDPGTAQKLLAGDGAAIERFGFSASLSADGSKALIGAPEDNSKGAAYVFSKGADGSWSQQAKLTAKDSAAGAGFGSSVSLSADGNTALLGASKNADKGCAYVFVKGADGSWSQQVKLTAQDGAAGDAFGSFVSLSAEGSAALIGADSDDDKGDNSGAAYVFVKGADGSWSQQAKLTAHDGAAGDLFGYPVSLSAEGGTALIGACNDDDKGVDSGSAYVFSKGADGSWSQQAKLTADDGTQNDWFGWAVSLSAADTALIGAPHDDNQGAAYVFVKGPNGRWTQQTKLTDRDDVDFDGFGWSVSLAADGRSALIGAYYGDAGKGSACVFAKGADDSWSQQVKLTVKDGAWNDWFGWAVSLSATGTALIGVQGDDDRGDDSGAAYVYGSTAAPQPTSKPAAVKP